MSVSLPRSNVLVKVVVTMDFRLQYLSMSGGDFSVPRRPSNYRVSTNGETGTVVVVLVDDILIIRPVKPVILLYV